MRWHHAWHLGPHGSQKSELADAYGSVHAPVRQHSHEPQVNASSGTCHISLMNPLNRVIEAF